MKLPKPFGLRKKQPKLRRVVGESMAPTLGPNQLLVFSGTGKCSLGDIVLVEHAGVEKVKRVSSLVENKVYLLGDNPDASTDSRHFGWLDKDHVQARLIWPVVR